MHVQYIQWDAFCAVCIGASLEEGIVGKDWRGGGGVLVRTVTL